jgi:transmembrane sensor
MTDRIDENPPMSIPEQAAEWLLRWHCGDLSIAERFEYLQWLKTSPVHIAETLRMCRLYSWLENTKLKLFITNEDSFSNIVELPPREREGATVRGGRSAGLWKTRIAAGAAAIALTATLAFVAKISWLDHTLQTQGSEWRSVPLSDGSSITATPYTRLRHVIADDQRRITLTQGWAIFRVAKDPSRPFIVEAGDAIVEATGTQFTVRRQPDGVTIMLNEGTVVISPSLDADTKFEKLSLKQDEQVTISAAGPSPVQYVDSDHAIERAAGRLTFGSGDTVSDAVQQFNQFNVMKIEVDHATGLRQMRGAFDAIDPLSFAASVARITGSPVVRESPELLRIGRRESHGR